MVLSRVLKSAKDEGSPAKPLQSSPSQGADVDVSGDGGVETFGGKKVPEKKLSLNAKQVIVGDYPKILDLRGYTFKAELFMHLQEEFDLADKEGRPPQPNISVSGSDSVEVIHFPGEGYDYAVVENLPNLKELHVHQGEWAGGGPTWLICQNLPRLESIVIKGAGVRWLQLKNVQALNSIDACGCEKLDYFSITRAPKLTTINLDGCRKLTKILDLSPADQKRLGVARQIATVQQSSRRDLTIYDDMTITDIDMVLANINLGAKLAKRRGLYRTGKSDESKAESDCDQFGFCLLRPLAYVYTGGTGESYCYEFMEEDESGIVSSQGNHTPEDCLGEALRCVASDWVLPFSNAASEDQVLTYLNLLVAAPTADPAEWVRTDDLTVRQALAANPLMSEPALKALANDFDLKVRLAIADNPATPDQDRIAVLDGLLKSKSPKVLEAVARNPATSEAVLRRLARSTHAKVLVAVAEHPATPDVVRVLAIEMLAKNVDSEVRLAIAKNKATPPAILACLANDKDLQVRQAVAEHPSTPGPIRIAVLNVLGNESNPKVLVAVARNPATPAPVLQMLAKNVNVGVRMAVALNLATPAVAIDVLAKDEEELVRQSVATNTATSAAAFGILVRDESWHMRLAIADNPSTPAAVFEVFAGDKEYSVRESVSKNPAAPIAALEILARDINDNIRMYVARHRATPTAVLVALSKDSYHAVRRDVAANYSTPNLVLKSLLTDGEEEVRSAAEAALSRTFPV